jgi:hypothetical protein
MRLFIFKSGSRTDLQAFTADPGGESLPKQFAPWHATGVVREDKTLPHNLKRDVVEREIGKAAYQLWRVKPEEKRKSARAAAKA